MNHKTARSADLAKSMPEVSLSEYLPKHLVPLPIFKRKIEFLKQISSEKHQTKKPSDMPTFSGSRLLSRGADLQERESDSPEL